VVFEPRFETGTSQMQNRNGNYLTTTFGALNRKLNAIQKVICLDI